MVDTIHINPEFYGNLQRMMAASPYPLTIASGFRSPERQAQLWDAALQKYGSPEAARKWVAPPGHSMHNVGEAVDLGFGGTGLGSGNQAAIDWAHQHAGDYGLTFPLSNENWHIEPMGARNQAQNNPTTQPVPTSGQQALLQPPGTMLPPALDNTVKPGDAFSTMAMLNEKFKPQLDAMQSFQQGYSGDKFMADMMSGVNPMRRMVFGALGNLYRSAFGGASA